MPLDPTAHFKHTSTYSTDAGGPRCGQPPFLRSHPVPSPFQNVLQDFDVNGPVQGDEVLQCAP